MTIRLGQISINGFKSIHTLDSFDLKTLTVLIGANGAGKSNFVAFFRALSHIMSGTLQSHVKETGAAHSWLSDGPETTREISASLTLKTDKGTNDYGFSLAFANPDTLYFTREQWRFLPEGKTEGRITLEGGAFNESRLVDRAIQGDKTSAAIRKFLQKIIVNQFHNTSHTSRIKQEWDVYENRWLKEDGGNLAPLLLRLREEFPPYYAHIVRTIQQSLPFFQDFELEPMNHRILLGWKERGLNRAFFAHQASDGMLRFFALVTLLLQPDGMLPGLLILDEPELGLHPHAITTIAGLIRAVSLKTQILVATQSVNLLNEFEPGDIVVVERNERESVFTRKEEPDLRHWLETYSLGELWEKNILGGQPA